MNRGCYVVDEEIEDLLETDPIAAHTKIMEMTRSQPVIVHKEYLGKQPFDNNDNGNDQPLLTDDQIDVVAAALVELRAKLRDEFQTMMDTSIAPLAEAVAVLQGQVSVLMNLIGTLVSNGNGNGNGIKSVEASEIKTTRRVRVRRSESTP
jgi:hypothetical protein